MANLNLKSKLRYVMSSNRRGRQSAHYLIESIKKQGEVALIGGAIRDIALFGNWGFKSDFDLVIKPNSKEKFLEFLYRECNLSEKDKNKYGGYSLLKGRWPVDIWILEDTWAAKAGHLEVRDFPDLLRATFFQIDAIVYELHSGKLWEPDNYSLYIKNKILKLNLEKNPNLLGNVARAFRYARTKRVSWGNDLAKLIQETLLKHKLTEFTCADRFEIEKCFAFNKGNSFFMYRLAKFLKQNIEESFSPYKEARQLSIFYYLDSTYNG